MGDMKERSNYRRYDNNTSSILVKPISKLEGCFTLKADSTELQIAMLIAIQAIGFSEITVYSGLCKDLFAVIRKLQSLGASIKLVDNSTIIVNGMAIGGIKEPTQIIDCEALKIMFYCVVGALAPYNFTYCLNVNQNISINYDLLSIADFIHSIGANVILSKLPLIVKGNQYAIPVEMNMANSSFYLKYFDHLIGMVKNSID